MGDVFEMPLLDEGPPPPSTVKRPFCEPPGGRKGLLLILPVDPDAEELPAAAEEPGLGAIGRGKIARRRLPEDAAELLVVDCGLPLELIERGDGPTKGGDGVLAEMVDGVQTG